MIASATPAIQAAWPWPTTSSPKMKIPITTEGTPFKMSSISRTNWLTRLLANSLVNMATRTPIGTAIAVAMATMMSEPTIALATPAPWLWPIASCGVGFVKKSRLSALNPFRKTVTTMRPSIATASSAASAAEADHELVHKPTTASPPVVPRKRIEHPRRCGAGTHPRFLSTRRMIPSATMLNISERMRRISAR